MPNLPKRPCRICGALSETSTCASHSKGSRKSIEGRPTARERGYTSDWDKARARFLRQHPLCVECKRSGDITPATVVDHIKPHRGDKTLFWNESNWQALCKPHHDKKTRRGE